MIIRSHSFLHDLSLPMESLPLNPLMVDTMSIILIKSMNHQLTLSSLPPLDMDLLPQALPLLSLLCLRRTKEERVGHQQEAIGREAPAEEEGMNCPERKRKGMSVDSRPTSQP
jgi:hypothetical protein